MTTIDELGRAAAATARDEARRTADVEAGLAEMRGESPVRLVSDQTGGWSSRRWLLVASAAAVIAMVVAITAVVQREAPTHVAPVEPSPSTVAPSKVAPSNVPASTVPATGPATTNAATAPTLAPATSVAPSNPSGLSVSYLDPPPMFQPEPFATVGLSDCADTSDCTISPEVAVMDGSVVVVDRVGQAALIVDGQTGEVRTQPLAVVPSLPVAGPGNVLYGLVQGNSIEEFAIKAVALAGVDAGRVVASAPLSINAYVELPNAPFGHGPTGVVDRTRVPGTQLIGYVDEQGGSTVLAESTPLYTLVDGAVTSTDTDIRWPLDIQRAPHPGSLFVGESPPAPTAGGAAVLWTWIGPAGADGDFPPPTMPVVAWLLPDGSAVWRGLPDGWAVAASDIWGTVLTRQTGRDVELAWLTAPGNLVLDRLAIGAGCAVPTCPSLVSASDGTLVSYDATARSITVHSATPRTIDVSGVQGIDSTFAAIVHIGPGDVAYMTAPTDTGGDPIGDLIAIALSGPNAGAEITRAVGVVDLSGDTDLVATARGLVGVDCCGAEQRRPAIDAEPVLAWVDRTGARIVDTGPQIWVEFIDGSMVVTRHDSGVDRSWTVTNVPGARGMPQTVATSDGGAMVFLPDVTGSTSGSRMIVLGDRPIVERSIAPYFPAVLEPSGSVIVFDDGYARVALD